MTNKIDYTTKSEHQRKYNEFLTNNNIKIIVGNGPAGTGKTYLACKNAVEKFKSNQIEKIIITRPVKSVEEELGFLPGDINEKMTPWMNPIFDILKEDVKHHEPNKYTDIQKDLAYKIQEETSDKMVELIRKAHELTGEKNIVVCGGYGLNCVANYKYLREFPDLNIYCEPISHDGGTSIGGAKYVHNKLEETTKPSKQESVYYGPQYDPTGYEADLEGLEVTDTSYDDVAKLLRERNIVTIYQGRSEGGPRALGNRSILFDPTIQDGKDYVNAVKHREWFRPFACSIKAENVHEWFDLAGREETPHMMYAVECLEGVEKIIPSVIHVDNTCRIQTVTQEQNEHYYNLISAFEKLSEVPILFNTSFNLGGDPLVETIEDAIDTLKNSDIEWMYLPEIQKLVHVPNE